VSRPPLRVTSVPIERVRTSIIIDSVPSLEQMGMQSVVKVRFREVTTVREELDETATKHHSNGDYINCREAPGANPKVELIRDPLAGFENFQVSNNAP
jgi:hypothetical protein